jgi:hypothetical protein
MYLLSLLCTCRSNVIPHTSLSRLAQHVPQLPCQQTPSTEGLVIFAYDKHLRELARLGQACAKRNRRGRWMTIEWRTVRIHLHRESIFCN